MNTYIRDCGFFDDDAADCAYRIQHDLEFYESGSYTCAVTYQMPAWGWSTWNAYNSNYQVYFYLK